MVGVAGVEPATSCSQSKRASHCATPRLKVMVYKILRFLHLFKEHEGCSPYERYTAIRMANAKGLLACTTLPIGEVGRRCGYADPLYFTQAFKRAVGLSPRAYRKEKGEL